MNIWKDYKDIKEEISGSVGYGRYRVFKIKDKEEHFLCVDEKYTSIDDLIAKAEQVEELRKENKRLKDCIQQAISDFGIEYGTTPFSDLIRCALDNDIDIAYNEDDIY